jgi:hypothetical protein
MGPGRRAKGSPGAVAPTPTSSIRHPTTRAAREGPKSDHVNLRERSTRLSFSAIERLVSGYGPPAMRLRAMSYNTSCLSNPWLLLGCRRPLPDDAACPVTASCRHGTTSVYREITRIAGGNSPITKRQSTPSGARIRFVPKFFPRIRLPTRQDPQTPRKSPFSAASNPTADAQPLMKRTRPITRTSQFHSTPLSTDQARPGLAC